MCKPACAFSLLILFSGIIQAQKISILQESGKTSLRGLSVVNDQTIWVSGSSGRVGLSTDSGKNWKWTQVPRYEKSDFRDIEAFSDREAVIMGVTEPAVILRTIDGGNNWSIVFEDSSEAMFLDAMDFSGDRGAVVGDPDQGKIFFAESVDRGKTWIQKLPCGFDTAAKGESFFAASGSNICHTGGSLWALVSGGKKSSLYFGSNRYPLFMNQGKETTGANSITIQPSDSNQAFITGGDFAHDTARYENSIHIQFHPFIQVRPKTPPHGYRSCVEYLDADRMICCGTSGVDFSMDGGMSWTLVSGKSFHVCRKSKRGRLVYLAGAHGIIARLDFL
jgi:photosystem II stability/assembly factor-like uncharacterized protein